EFFSTKTEVAWVSAGIHSNRIARASLHAVSAIDAPKSVDLVADRILFDLVFGVLTSLYIDTVRGTSGGAKKTGGALHRSVVFKGKSMAPAIGVGIGPTLFRVLHGDGGSCLSRQTELLQNVNCQVAPEPIARHRQATDHLGKIEAFPEGHFFDAFHDWVLKDLIICR